jgi:hypothetical protein
VLKQLSKKHIPLPNTCKNSNWLSTGMPSESGAGEQNIPQQQWGKRSEIQKN